MSWWSADSLDPATVVDRFAARVYRHLRSIFGPTADIDDVYQMVFVEILRALPGFRGQARLSTYIRRITWNVAYQEMRQSYRQRRLSFLGEMEPDDPVTIDAESRADRSRALAAVYEALAALPPKLRAVVVMHDIEQLTLKEIAQHLGRPPATVASQLYAGRRQASALVASDPRPRQLRSGDKAGPGTAEGADD